MGYAQKKYLPPGFTLVEIMVAMVITLIVMGGVYQTLRDEDVNHDRSEKILDMQNNARVALERVVRDIRRTGSLGCGGDLAANTLSNTVTTETDFIQRLTVNPASPSPDNWLADKPILSTLVDKAGAGSGINFLSEVMGFNNNANAHQLYQQGTDALTLVYLSDERALAAAMGSTTNPIVLKSSGFDTNDILYITDCSNYSLFQKTNGPAATVQHAASGLNNSADLMKNYGDQSAARVFKLNTATYFVHTGDFNLCYNATNQAIASNIEDLQFEFLSDENNDGNLADDLSATPSHWRTVLAAPVPTSAKAVRAIRIWVLAMSEPDYTYTDTNTYVYPGSPYDPDSPATLLLPSPVDGEHRHRYLASAVVFLRNAGQ